MPTRKTSPVSAGNTGRIEQYNNLRDEAAKSAEFLACQQSTPNMTLKVLSGTISIGGSIVSFAGGNSPTFTAPTTNPRIDLLVLNSSGSLEIIQGTESASPSPPNYPTYKFVICEVYHRVGETCIKETSDGSNGYIYKDVRAFLGIFNNPFSNFSQPSRSLDTIYQNTSGKTLIAIVQVEVGVYNQEHARAQAIAEIGSSSPTTEIGRFSAFGPTYYYENWRGVLILIVPPNYYYRVRKETYGSSSYVMICSWTEFTAI